MIHGKKRMTLSNWKPSRYVQWCASTHNHELMPTDTGNIVMYQDAKKEIDRLWNALDNIKTNHVGSCKMLPNYQNIEEYIDKVLSDE
jgi:hypothetical protein